VRSRYRWAVLGAGTGAQAAFAAFLVGTPVLAPALRDEYDLTLADVGLVLTSVWVGATLTLLPWGLLADRTGERAVLAGGLGVAGLAAVGAAFAPTLGALVLALVVGGAAGVSVNSASGRAVMQWFEREERGLAFGVRQTAIPLGGVAAALALPAAERAGGLDTAFLVLAALCFAGALAGGIVLRETTHEEAEAPVATSSMRDRRLWVLALGGGLYVFAQVALTGFLVLFLHDERGFSTGAAAAALALVNVLGAALRVVVGAWSDRTRTRLAPLKAIGIAVAAALVATALVLPAPVGVAVPALIAVSALSMAWNGLAFTAAVELAGRARSGAAIGFQQTALSLFGIVAPIAFAALVETTSWRAAFALLALSPLAGWLVLRPLPEPRTR
jgi:sugar phosphate permease